ncbi:MAG: type II toxin-antitoxin system Phd/YefM family antitoxin [Micropepsaceae bacterium]
MREFEWQMQQAKNKLSELVDRAATGEAQVILRHGKRVAALISMEAYAQLRPTAATQSQNFVEHLLSAPKGNFRAPKRTKRALRDAPI